MVLSYEPSPAKAVLKAEGVLLAPGTGVVTQLRGHWVLKGVADPVALHALGADGADLRV